MAFCPAWHVTGISFLQIFDCSEGDYAASSKPYALLAMRSSRLESWNLVLAHLPCIEPGICGCAILLPQGCIAVVLGKVGKYVIHCQREDWHHDLQR